MKKYEMFIPLWPIFKLIYTLVLRKNVDFPFEKSGTGFGLSAIVQGISIPLLLHILLILI